MTTSEDVEQLSLQLRDRKKACQICHYERTKQLLFSGAQKAGQIPLGQHLPENCHKMTVDEPIGNMVHHAPGQLCLASGGQLTAPSALGFVNGVMCNNNNNIIANQPMLKPFLTNDKVSTFVCKSCQRPLGLIQPCSFCDGPTCLDCMRRCENCSGQFCSFCSVLNYDVSMERAFCLNCSS